MWRARAPSMRVSQRSKTLISTIVVASLSIGCGDDSNTDPSGDGTSSGDGGNQPIYDPYPPGLLPPDLVSELDRIEREVDEVFARALAEWRATPSPTETGNPPILQNTGMRLVQLLGKLELFDKSISVFKNLACTSCHMPYTAFSGPISSLNLATGSYVGSVEFRMAKRKPQGYTYSPYYPALELNQTQQDFYGGNFWDLRATGYKIQSADAEQAQHPPVDTQEHGFPDIACVVFALSNAPYRPLFELIWGSEAFDIKWPTDTARICSTPGGATAFNPMPGPDTTPNTTPVKLSTRDRARANTTFDQFGLSITAYERSEDVSAFSSKFDAFLAGNATLTADEMAGWQLFRGKGLCNTCHLDGTERSSSTVTQANLTNVAPLFTDFTSANLGLPRNANNPWYFENVADPFGFTPNPQGADFIDLGVGLFLRSEAGGVNPNESWTPLAPMFDGKFQVATVRNVDMRPCPSFVKSYMHNGYLKSLKEVVHFYNTRDVFRADTCTPATEKITCWPAAEVTANMDMTIGNLGLTDQEENQIVAFLQTLTDGFTRPYPDADVFSGTCP